MSATLDDIAQDALILSADQRLELARMLLDSVETDSEPGADETWAAEITRRIALFDAGDTKTIPAAEVFARLRKIAPG